MIQHQFPKFVHLHNLKTEPYQALYKICFYIPAYAARAAGSIPGGIPDISPGEGVLVGFGAVGLDGLATDATAIVQNY